jgi:hypothetical protein
MVALVVVSTFVVLLLGLLVAGLLRSHADILRSLHELGVGVGDPTAEDGLVPSVPAVPVALEPTPTGLDSDEAPTVAGVTPNGDARAVAVANGGPPTLLAFLSSGCATCAGFWTDLQQPGRLDLGDVRTVIVTKGPDMEISSDIDALSTGRVPVVMSTEAWLDYKVPASPFFVLVDGASGRRVGHGVAAHPGQLADLVRRAEREAVAAADPGRATGLDGPAREAANDEVLLAAGITPGHPSLYPKTFGDVFPFAAQSPPDGGPERTEHTERAG